MNTLASRYSGLSPEIAYFWDEDVPNQTRDWYIKQNSYVTISHANVILLTLDHRPSSPSYDARYILRYGCTVKYVFYVPL